MPENENTNMSEVIVGTPESTQHLTGIVELPQPKPAKIEKATKNIRDIKRLMELPPSKMTDAEKSALISDLKKTLADLEDKNRTAENKIVMLSQNCESAYNLARQATGELEALRQKKQIQDSYLKQATNVFYQSMLLAIKE